MQIRTLPFLLMTPAKLWITGAVTWEIFLPCGEVYWLVLTRACIDSLSSYLILKFVVWGLQEEEMTAIMELLATISPISSGNYPSTSRLLLRKSWQELGAECRGAGSSSSVSLEWPTRRSTICVRGELGMSSVWYYCSFLASIILNIGESSYYQLSLRAEWVLGSGDTRWSSMLETRCRYSSHSLSQSENVQHNSTFRLENGYH